MTAPLVSLDQPLWLAIGVMALAPPAMALRSRGRRWAWTLVRSAAIALVAVAMAGPSVRGIGAAKCVLVLRDVSASMAGADPLRTAGLTSDDRTDRAESAGDRLGDAESPTELAGEAVERYDFAASVVQPGQTVDVSATRVQTALELAAARAGDCSAIVIATDGRFAEEGWEASAKRLAQTGTGVLIVAPKLADSADATNVSSAHPHSPGLIPPDAALTAMQAHRRADGTVALRVEASANSALKRRLMVRRVDPPAELLVRQYELSPQAPLGITVLDDNAPAGACEYKAYLLSPDQLGNTADAADASGDRVCANDELAAWAQANQRALAVLGDAPLVALANLPNVSTLAPADAPREAGPWSDYAAVLLDGAAIAQLDPQQRRAIAQFVEAGGAMVLLGPAPNACQADRDDPLTRVAALLANDQARSPLDLAVVLDASGSMAPAGGKNGSFVSAARAVSALRAHLGPRDRLTVLTFGLSARTIYEGAGDNLDGLEAALAQVAPAGPTDIAPALQLAAVPPADGATKLVLVLSDLAVAPLDARAVAARLAAAKASLAVVAVTSASSPQHSALEDLVAAAGGTITRRADLAGLDEVFAGLVRRHQPAPRREGTFAVSSADAQWPAPVPAWPIHAYQPAIAAEGAQVALTVAGDPLLARRVVGLGRSAAVAIDAQDLAGVDRAWVTSVVANLLDWAHLAGDPQLAGELDRSGSRAALSVRAADDAGPINGLQLHARWRGTDGDVHQADLEQTSPGLYEAGLAEQVAGTIEIADSPGQRRLVLEAGSACQTELRAIGPDGASLRRLGALTDGRVIDADQLASALQQRGGRWPITGLVLAMALALMLADWLVRPRRR